MSLTHDTRTDAQGFDLEPTFAAVVAELAYHPEHDRLEPCTIGLLPDVQPVVAVDDAEDGIEGPQ